MHSTKRKRSEIDLPIDQQTKKTRSGVWFDDGNIILEAEQMQFCVHRSVLAKHSDVFRSMFDLATPDDGNNCPVLQIADKAQDVEHLLNALYDRFYYSSELQPLPVLIAMVRLGTKYAFIKLRDDAMSRLSYEYPNNLEGFMRDSDWTRIDIHHHVLELDILNLAWEHRIYTILPVLYLNISGNFTLNMLCESVKRPDGSIIEISQEEKLRCGVGFEKLRDASQRLAYGWTKQLPYPSCNSSARLSCSIGGQRIYFHLFTQAGSLLPGLVAWDSSWDKRLCSQCAAAAREVHMAGRQKIWDSVPEFFCLPPWKELTNFV